MVWPVAGTEGQVEEEGLIRADSLSIVDELDGSVDQILGEMVSLFRRCRRIYAMGVIDQIRIPLAGMRLQESIEPLKAPARGPFIVRPCRIDVSRRSKMPLAHSIGIIAHIFEHLRHRGGIL